MGHFHSLDSQRGKSPDVVIIHKQGLYTEKNTRERNIDKNKLEAKLRNINGGKCFFGDINGLLRRCF